MGRILDMALGLLAQRAPEVWPGGLFGQELEEQESASYGQINFVHLEDHAQTDGAFIFLDVTKANCSECRLSWGDKIDFLSILRVPTNLKKDDEIAFTMDAVVDTSESPLSQLLQGAAVNLKGVCGVCGGSCRVNASWDNSDRNSFSMTMPTMRWNRKYCDVGAPKKNVTELLLLDRRVHLPKIDTLAEQFSATFNISLALLRDGQELTSSSATMELLPNQEMLPDEETSRLSGEPPKLEAPQEPPGLLQVALGKIIDSLAEHVTEDEDADEQRLAEDLEDQSTRVNAVVANLVVYDLENPSGNISVKSGHNCKDKGDHGSAMCWLEFGEPGTYSSSVHLAANFDESSYFLVSAKPKVSGFAGSILRKHLDYLEIQDIELPLCGEHSAAYQMHGKWKMWKPIPCGFYAMDLEVGSKELALPKFIRMPRGKLPFQLPGMMPGMNFNLALFPPSSLDFRIKMFHRGAIPIMDLELKFALEHIF